MSIESISLQNFQGHRKSTLKLCSGVNVIVGSSDAGKTSIFRAFRWVNENRPLGNSIVREGQDTTTVEMIVDETKIKKERKKNKTKYVVNNTVFEAVKSDVPDDVINAINMDEINISYQLTPHYMILDSKGKIAETLNRLTNLDRVSDVVMSLNRNVRENNQGIKNNEENLAEVEKTLKQSVYQELDEVSAVLFEIESKATDVFELEEKETAIKLSLNSLQKQQEILKTYKQLPTPEQINKYDVRLAKIKNTVGDLQKIKDSLISFLSRLKNSIVECKDYLEKSEELNDIFNRKLLRLKTCPFCEGKISNRKKFVSNVQKRMG